jgi:hypothetical protein
MLDKNGRPISPVQIHLQRQGALSTAPTTSNAPIAPAGSDRAFTAKRPEGASVTMSTGRPSFRDMRVTQGSGQRIIDQVDHTGRPISPVHAALDAQISASAQRRLDFQSSRPSCEHPSEIESCRDAGMIYPEEAHQPEQAAEIARLAIGGPERRLTLNGAKASKKRGNYTRVIGPSGLPYPFPPSVAVMRPSEPLQRHLSQQSNGAHMGANSVAPWAGRAGLSSNCGSRYSSNKAVKKSSKKRKRRGILSRLFGK